MGGRLLIAIGGIALYIAMAVSTPSAWATPLNYTFAVTATTGPLAGTSSKGSFRFDSSLIPEGGGVVERAGLLGDLAFVWNGIAYDETTANTGRLIFDPQGHLFEAGFGNHCFPAGGCAVSSGTNEWHVLVDEDGTWSRFHYATASSSSVHEGTVTLEGPIPIPAIPMLDRWALVVLAFLVSASARWTLVRHRPPAEFRARHAATRRGP